MNEAVFNIGYQALQQIMELSNIILEGNLDEYQQHTLTKAINMIAIQNKYMMFEKKEEEK